MKSKCLHLAQLKLQYERGVECSLENNQKGGRYGKFSSSLTLEVYLENGKDPQINLGLAQDRT